VAKEITSKEIGSATNEADEARFERRTKIVGNYADMQR
jgi:hypothetical protein